MTRLLILSLVSWLSVTVAHPDYAELGIELESNNARIEVDELSFEERNLLKAHKVKGHAGSHWSLTVDTSPASSRELNLEYDMRVRLDDEAEMLKTVEELVEDTVSRHNLCRRLLLLLLHLAPLRYRQ